MSSGSVFKKCGCREPVLGAGGVQVLDAAGKPKWRRLGASCPKLRSGSGWSPRHGSWHVQVEFVDAAAGRQVIGKGGLGSRAEAEALRDGVRDLLRIADRYGDSEQEIGQLRVQIAQRIRADLASSGRLPDADEVLRAVRAGVSLADRMTVGQWLRRWLDGRVGLSASTRRIYESHLRNYLNPHLGAVPLERLRVAQVAAMFTAIAADAEMAKADNAARHRVEAEAKAAWNRKDTAAWRRARDQLASMPAYRRPCEASTRLRIRATLRSALTAAQREQLVLVNVASLVQMPAGRSAKARVWTTERVRRWRATGEVPSPVMVWTPQQTSIFLKRAARHEQYALFLLLAFTGMRRGEAVGLRWVDVDSEAKVVHVARQVVQNGWEVEETEPKSESSIRPVMLSDELAIELTRYRQWQDAARKATGEEWVDSGRVFTTADGSGLHPASVSAWFKQLAREADLPPIRLHDLRHGAASLMLAANVDIKVVSELLGHSGTTITRDIYTSVFDPLKRRAVQAAAALMAAAAPWTESEAERKDVDESPGPVVGTGRGGHRRRKAVLSGVG